MGETTGIEWATATWNPWTGCAKVSPGCAHCYMFREKVRYGQNPEIIVRSKTTFTAPLRWKEPQRIFSCSWSDFFIEQADPWRPEAWNVILNTPRHSYLILTKRIRRVAGATMPKNVWLGVSVENSRYLERIEMLRQIDAKVRFISFEPLLASTESYRPWSPEGIHWSIVGGESGPGARPMDLDWAREIRDKCAKFGIAFFMKQICRNGRPIPFEQFPEDLRIREFPSTG